MRPTVPGSYIALRCHCERRRRRRRDRALARAGRQRAEHVLRESGAQVHELPGDDRAVEVRELLRRPRVRVRLDLVRQVYSAVNGKVRRIIFFSCPPVVPRAYKPTASATSFFSSAYRRVRTLP